MNITRRQLRDQYNRVVRLGWLPFFEEAAKTITKGYYDTADLLGISSRETNLDPKWLTKAGDGGNGFGLMQADKFCPLFYEAIYFNSSRPFAGI